MMRLLRLNHPPPDLRFTKLAEEEESPTRAFRHGLMKGVSRGQQVGFAAKNPMLFLAAKAFMGQSKEAAQQTLREVAEELEKDAARHGGGWDSDGGVQAYAMTPRGLGISSGGGRLGGSATFSDLVSQSMRPTLASGLVMGGYPSPSAQGLIAAYRGAATGEGAVGWLPTHLGTLRAAFDPLALLGPGSGAKGRGYPPRP